MENNTNLQNQDPYSSTSPSRKVVDFILGYFGFFVIILIMYAVLTFAIYSFPRASLLFTAIMTLGVILIILVVNGIIKIKRKYIAKGVNFALLTIILFPILFFGACLMALSGTGF